MKIGLRDVKLITSRAFQSLREISLQGDRFLIYAKTLAAYLFFGLFMHVIAGVFYVVVMFSAGLLVQFIKEDYQI